MEVFLAVLMAIGIFVVAPALIGFAIVGGYVARERTHIARTLRYQGAGAEVKATEPESELVAAGPRKQK